MSLLSLGLKLSTWEPLSLLLDLQCCFSLWLLHHNSAFLFYFCDLLHVSMIRWYSRESVGWVFFFFCNPGFDNIDLTSLFKDSIFDGQTLSDPLNVSKFGHYFGLFLCFFLSPFQATCSKLLMARLMPTCILFR